MVRRTALVAILAGPVTAAVHFLGCGRSGPEAQVTNVILIVIDTLRSDHLGCYGYSEIRTPVMDDLARNGTLFEQGITPVPVTVPAFTSLLTSRSRGGRSLSSPPEISRGESRPTRAPSNSIPS